MIQFDIKRSLTVSPLLPFSPGGPPTRTVSPCEWQHTCKHPVYLSYGTFSHIYCSIIAYYHCVYSYIPPALNRVNLMKELFQNSHCLYNMSYFPLSLVLCQSSLGYKQITQPKEGERKRVHLLDIKIHTFSPLSPCSPFSPWKGWEQNISFKRANLIHCFTWAECSGDATSIMTDKNGKRTGSIHLLPPSTTNPCGTLMYTETHRLYTRLHKEKWLLTFLLWAQFSWNHNNDTITPKGLKPEYSKW